MAGTLHIISIVSFVLAAVFAVLAVALWFLLKIHNVIGDLSGRNAKKSIAQMRQNNEKSGNKSYKASLKNVERGKLTETMHGLGKNGEDEETGLLNENLASSYENEETGLLVDEDSTGILNEETGSLEDNNIISKRLPSNVNIEMLDEAMLIHTEEVI